MNRDFKGVWIPKEIWLNKELTMIEKVIYTEINSLDNENHCIAGNDYFAEFCNCSESAVTKAIKHLQALNLIEILSFDGRHRKIRVVNFTRQSSKFYEADSENLRAINTINNTTKKKLLIDKSINNNIVDSGTPEVQEFVKLYRDICVSLPNPRYIQSARKKAIINIVKKYSLEDIKTVFTNAQASDFLTGKNDRGWKADIDFILREDKFISILEGKYNGKKQSVSAEGRLKLNRSVDKDKFWEEVKSGKAQKF